MSATSEDLVYQAIDQSDLWKIKELFNELDLTEDLLIKSLNYSAEEKENKILDFILDVCAEYFPVKSLLPYLLSLESVSVDVLTFLKDKEKKETAGSVAVDLLECENSKMIVPAFKRFFEVYGEQTMEFYRLLFFEINDRLHSDMYSFGDLVDYLDSRVEELKDKYAEKPYYILKNKSKLLESIYGPSSKGPDEDVSENKECMKGEGCHMLLCNHISSDIEEDDEEPQEWFKGYCEVCHLRLCKKCYALRRPAATGGWVGCYCSSECVIRDTPQYCLEAYVIKKVMEDIMYGLEKNGINDT
jgi:hypothetical protein